MHPGHVISATPPTRRPFGLACPAPTRATIPAKADDREDMVTHEDTRTAAEALVRARDADRMLWSTALGEPGGSRHRRERDRAVRSALAAGMSAEQLADELGVRIADVERMGLAGHDPE